MLLFCDQLTLGACIGLLRLRPKWAEESAPARVRVLDPIPAGAALWRAILERRDLRVEEAQFFAGHLRTPNGEAVRLAARRASYDLAFHAAERLVARSDLLRRLNREWERNTILLHLARSCWTAAERLALRVMVADALARQEGQGAACLLLQRSELFDPDSYRHLASHLTLHHYCGPPLPKDWQLRRRLRPLVWWMGVSLREMLGRLGPRHRREVGDISGASGENPPSLILLQDDELSPDRSYRTQPHWLFPEHDRLPFPVFILRTDSAPQSPADADGLAAQGVTAVDPGTYLAPRLSRTIHPVQRRLRRDLRACAFHALWGSAAQSFASYNTSRLLYDAHYLATFCQAVNAKASMTCDPYKALTDVMQIIAPHLAIRTLCYQYSNLSAVSPLMMTTADHMLSFSPLYHERWVRDGIKPESFTPVGYTFDTSFRLLQRRADQWREKLHHVGARFVICYFDETIEYHKFGTTSVHDHQSMFLALIDLLLHDSSLGVIVKTQFQRNSPEQFADLSELLAKAEATGRYVELVRGSHRNIVFPAEAALAADIAIGHINGATAPLEAALVGRRSLLINTLGLNTANDALYAQADIVYPSLSAALQAISEFRAGVPERSRLGDWSPILHHFDPFRDGQAALRTRKVLEAAVLQDGPVPSWCVEASGVGRGR